MLNSIVLFHINDCLGQEKISINRPVKITYTSRKSLALIMCIIYGTMDGQKRFKINLNLHEWENHYQRHKKRSKYSSSGILKLKIK